MNEKLERLFSRYISYMKSVIELDQFKSPTLILFKKQKDGIGEAIYPVPNMLFGTDRGRIAAFDFMKAMAQEGEADAVMFFSRAKLGMIGSADSKADAEKMMRRIEVEGVDISDVEHEADILLCMAETKTKQMINVLEIVNKSPYEWKDFVADGKIIANLFANIIYESKTNFVNN